MAELEFTNREVLRVWLEDKPAEWARVIAHRVAMRVLPLLAEEWRTEAPIERKRVLTLAVFRASITSRVADSVTVASAIADASSSATNVSAFSAARSVASAAFSAASPNAASHAAEAVASAAAAYSAAAADSAIWRSVSLDAQWLLERQDRPPPELAKALLREALWREKMPDRIRQRFEELFRAVRADSENWNHWISWYSAAAAFDGGPTHDYFGEALELRIAEQPDQWWDRRAEAVNADIAKWVGKQTKGRVKIAAFIVDHLKLRGEPVSNKELYSAFESAGHRVLEKSVRGQLSRLASEGRITRVAVGLYASSTLKPVDDSRDFFISYSHHDQDSATEIDRIVRSAGYTTWFQPTDVGGGANFANWMKRAIPASRRLIAIYSPDYEKSGHGQAEWNAFYNEDPMAEKERIIGFVVRKTRLNVLAKQIVYRKVVGLSGVELRNAVLQTVRAAQQSVPLPKEESPTPYEVGWSEDDQLALTGGGMDRIFVPQSRSPQDARNRLDAGKKLAADLVAEFRGHNGVDRRYVDAVENYGRELPSDHDGNIYHSDLAADRLRRRLIREAKGGELDLDFAEGLIALLKHHQGMRVYFPDLMLYRSEASTGELAKAAPHEYFEKLLELIVANTPIVFAENISAKLGGAPEVLENADHAVTAEEKQEATEEGIVPAELLNDIDPQAAADIAKAGLLNRIYQGLLTFETGAKNADRIEKTIASYGKLIKHVLDWLP